MMLYCKCFAILSFINIKFYHHRIISSSYFIINHWFHLLNVQLPRHLAGQVATEWQETDPEDQTKMTELTSLAREIVPYHMSHNAEAEAFDLLMEVECLHLAQEYVDEQAYSRVCLYLTRLDHLAMTSRVIHCVVA